jgi:hypothetical protein
LADSRAQIKQISEEFVEEFITTLEKEQAEKAQIKLAFFIGNCCGLHHFDIVFRQIKQWSKDASTEKRLLAIRMLQDIDAEHSSIIRRNLSIILDLLSQHLQEKNAKLRTIALRTIRTIIIDGQLEKKEVQRLASLVPLILKSISESLNTGDYVNTNEFLAVLSHLIPHGQGVLFADYIQPFLSAMYQIVNAKLDLLTSEGAAETITELMIYYKKKVTTFPKFMETMIQLSYNLYCHDVDQYWSLLADDVTFYSQIASRCITKMAKVCKKEELFRQVVTLMTQKASGTEKERSAAISIMFNFILGMYVGKRDLIPYYDKIVPMMLHCTQDSCARVRYQAIAGVSAMSLVMLDPNYVVPIIEAIERGIDDVDDRVQRVTLHDCVSILERPDLHKHEHYFELMDRLFPKIIKFFQCEDAEVRKYAMDDISCATGAYIAKNYDKIVSAVKGQGDDVLELRFFSYIVSSVPMEVIEPDIDRIITLLFKGLKLEDIEQFEETINTCGRIIVGLNTKIQPHVQKIYFTIRDILAVPHPGTYAPRLLRACAKLYSALNSYKLLDDSLTQNCIEVVYKLFTFFQPEAIENIKAWTKVLYLGVTAHPSDLNTMAAINSLFKLLRHDRPLTVEVVSLVVHSTNAVLELNDGDEVVKVMRASLLGLLNFAIDTIEDIRTTEPVPIDVISSFYEEASRLAGMMVSKLDEFTGLDELVGHFLEIIINDPNNEEVRYGLLELIRRVLIAGGKKVYIEPMMGTFFASTMGQEATAQDMMGKCLVVENYGLIGFYGAARLHDHQVQHMLAYLLAIMNAQNSGEELMISAMYSFVKIVQARGLDVSLIEEHVVPNFPLQVSDARSVFSGPGKLYRLLVNVCNENPRALTPNLRRELAKVLELKVREKTKTMIQELLRISTEQQTIS